MGKLRLVKEYPGVPPDQFGVDFSKWIWRSRAQTLSQAEYHAEELVQRDEEEKRKREEMARRH